MLEPKFSLPLLYQFVVWSRTSREVTALSRKRVAIESSFPQLIESFKKRRVPVECSNRSKVEKPSVTKASSFNSIMERIENCLQFPSEAYLFVLVPSKEWLLKRLVLTDLLLSYIFVYKLQPLTTRYPGSQRPFLRCFRFLLAFGRRCVKLKIPAARVEEALVPNNAASFVARKPALAEAAEPSCLLFQLFLLLQNSIRNYYKYTSSFFKKYVFWLLHA